MIIIDQMQHHDQSESTTGNNQIPTGITGEDWCHLVSTTSLAELTTFLTANVLTVQCLPTNIRTPLLGSFVTYCGLTSDQRDAAIFAGASPQRPPYVFQHAFDYDTNSPPATYEP